MEITMNSLSYSKLQTPPLFYSRPSIFACNSASFGGFNGLPRKLLCNRSIKIREQRKFGVVQASEAESTFTEVGEKWLLEPVGDGDSRHIGFKVAMPGALEIASSVVTVGRVAEKADIVIPVATVSALHARIQQKDGSLVVTDLDSTNGTFIDDKRLSPGVAAAVSPGRCITFAMGRSELFERAERGWGQGFNEGTCELGDVNLASFRVSKLENVEVSAEPEESKTE
ncbi:hypothetical protein LguiB_031741 [Lonicera macranthoides]